MRSQYLGALWSPGVSQVGHRQLTAATAHPPLGCSAGRATAGIAAAHDAHTGEQGPARQQTGGPLHSGSSPHCLTSPARSPALTSRALSPHPFQVSEKDWAVVILDASGQVRELQIDEATAKQVQSGALTPDQLAAMLAAQQSGGGGGGEEKAS